MDLKFDDGVWMGEQSYCWGKCEVLIDPERNVDNEVTPAQMGGLQQLGDGTGFWPLIRDHAIKYFHRTLNYIDRDEFQELGIHIDESTIEKNFKVFRVFVPRHAGTQDRLVFLTAHCDWNPSEGMDIFIHDGRIVECGPTTTLPLGAAWERYLSGTAEVRQKMLMNVYGGGAAN